MGTPAMVMLVVLQVGDEPEGKQEQIDLPCAPGTRCRAPGVERSAARVRRHATPTASPMRSST